jgi:hypothetical protein
LLAVVAFCAPFLVLDELWRLDAPLRADGFVRLEGLARAREEDFALLADPLPRPLVGFDVRPVAFELLPLALELRDEEAFFVCAISRVSFVVSRFACLNGCRNAYPGAMRVNAGIEAP